MKLTVTTAEVTSLAATANKKLDDNKAAELQAHLTKQLETFSALSEVDTAGLAPLFDPNGGTNRVQRRRR